MKQIKIVGVPEHFNLPWQLSIEKGDFEAKNIETNVLEQGWNGTFRGKRVQQGVYVFYAEVERKTMFRTIS